MRIQLLLISAVAIVSTFVAWSAYTASEAGKMARSEMMRDVCTQYLKQAEASGNVKRANYWRRQLAENA